MKVKIILTFTSCCSLVATQDAEHGYHRVLEGITRSWVHFPCLVAKEVAMIVWTLGPAGSEQKQLMNPVHAAPGEQ